MLLPILYSLLGGVVIAKPIDTFTNVTVYDPGTTAQVSYARTVDLANNTVLAVWNDYEQPNDAISIYRSTDSGYSWRSFGNVTSDEPGRKLLQPYLIYLDPEFGEDYGGTVVLAVNAVDDRSTNIELYASWDDGQTFQFESRVASGGPVDATDGATPVSEPFLLQHGSLLTLYYSDQRDPQHTQKLTHQTTREWLDDWHSAIDAASFENTSAKAGMSTVAKLPNGQYILAFEYGMLNDAGSYSYPVYYKLSSSPENFASESARKIVVDTGVQPNGGPYITWTAKGGDNGTIVLSDSSSKAVYINQALGLGDWRQLDIPAARSYSRELKIPINDDTKLRITGGAEYNQGTHSQILVTVLDFEKALGVSQ